MTNENTSQTEADKDTERLYTIVGRRASRTISSDNGFAIVQAGDLIDDLAVERAIRCGRLFELTRSASRV